MSDRKQSLEERLKDHPYLRERFEAMLDIVEAAEGDVEKADEAELLVIEQVRQLGNELLHGWAKSKMAQQATTKQKEGKATGHGKKNSSGTRRSER